MSKYESKIKIKIKHYDTTALQHYGFKEESKNQRKPAKSAISDVVFQFRGVYMLTSRSQKDTALPLT